MNDVQRINLIVLWRMFLQTSAVIIAALVLGYGLYALIDLPNTEEVVGKAIAIFLVIIIITMICAGFACWFKNIKEDMVNKNE